MFLSLIFEFSVSMCLRFAVMNVERYRRRIDVDLECESV